MAFLVRSRFLRQTLGVRDRKGINSIIRSLECRSYSSPHGGASSNASSSNTLLIVGGVALATTTLVAYKLNVFSPYGGGSSSKDGEKETQSKSAPESESAPGGQDEATAADSQSHPVEEKSPDKEKPVLIDIPDSVSYLLIGGGTASFTAARVILEKDPEAKVLIITEEDFVPYMRPPLSKELWFTDDLEKASSSLIFKQWIGKERSVFYKDESFYESPEALKEKNGVAILRGQKVTKISQEEKVAVLDDGRTIGYGKLLIATGGKPRTLPIFEKAPKEIQNKITLFRNINDFRHLVQVCEKAKSIAIIGGGFLGSELACALGKTGAKSDIQVTQIFPETGNMGLVFPKYLSNWTTNQVKKEGVDVLSDSTVSSITSKDGRILLKTSKNKEILADHVIVAVGIGVENDLAATSGLEVDSKDGGFHVNAELQAASNIWVAGDAACFYDFKLGCRRRVEHHDHAVVSGRLAGENMTGNHKRYEHQSMFWSDLGPKIGYEAIGIVDSSLKTVSVWASAMEADTPKAAAESSGTGIRSEVQDEGAAVADNTAKKEEKSDEASSSDGGIPGQSELEEADELDFGKGIVFYMKNQKVVGVICWNIFNQIPVARRIIDEGKVYENADEVYDLGKAFKIFS
ncbi:apoptosis-inducing factor 1, mitochondrial-like isoform X2 [Oscarella lobularis]|uniref:apoptosis-inducing factor 1, mitochondrial-like isoform X2 n=1 Tax=Oscarella lobularis TaxID=121494 RepID=UPI0033140FD5